MDWGGLLWGKEKKGLKDPIECIQFACQRSCLTEPCA